METPPLLPLLLLQHRPQTIGVYFSYTASTSGLLLLLLLLLDRAAAGAALAASAATWALQVDQGTWAVPAFQQQQQQLLLLLLLQELQK